MVNLKKKKKSGNLDFVMDILHMIIGVVIVILSVIAFLSPEEHLLFFPVIFVLAAVIHFMLWFRKYTEAEGIKKKLASFIYFVLGSLYTGIAVIELITM
jgi:putative membrane protein